MKKKFLYGFAVLAIAAVAAVNVTLSSNKYGLSDVSLANVEALAKSEGDDDFGMYNIDEDLCCIYGHTTCLKHLFQDECK